MTLEPAALAKILQMLDGIRAGKTAPRAHGEIGQFLRMCESTRLEIQQVLAREGIAVRPAGWSSGQDLGVIELSLLRELRGSVPTELWGPVEHAPALCEQLGSIVDLTLWTSARAANRAHVLASGKAAVTLRLEGGYRWFPPGRITTGDAHVELIDAREPDWRKVRFLKATADDVGRAPHPLEYILDYRLGPPALKVLRVFPVRKEHRAFHALPALHDDMRRLRLNVERVALLKSMRERELALVFAYREPWNDDWEAVDATCASPDDCLGHSVAWADFRAELRGESRLAAADVQALRAALHGVGVSPSPSADSMDSANLSRQMLPVARALVRWLRYRT